MDTKQYIGELKRKSRKASVVALRQSLFYYLYHQKKISATMISKITGHSRQLIYHNVYTAMDLLKMGDEIIQSALNETMEHTIVIKPCTIDNGVISTHVGYKMLIDNLIY